MRWKKFHSILEQNSWLIHHIGNPGIVFAYLDNPSKEAKKILKKWIQKHLDFVAFRPFEKLDLKSENSANVEYPDSENTVVYSWINTYYTIHFHIKKEDKPFSRSRHVMFRHDDAFDTKEFSIRKVIQYIVVWYLSYWHKQGNDICWDAIIKDTRYGNDEGIKRQEIEIFPFPEYFNHVKAFL